jgi:diguanylate cyclase (GGDEF)-like protein
VPFHGGRQDVTLSTTFVFALLLFGFPAVAILAQAAASGASDAVARKSWWKTLFNLAQYAIGVAAAEVVLRTLGSHPIVTGTPLTIGTVGVILASGLTLYVVNNLLIGTAIALSQTVPFRVLLRNDMLFQGAVMFVLISQAPLLLVALERGHWLLPLFIPAVGVAYANGRASIQRDHDATHDPLTGLANRALLQHQIRIDLENGEHVAVLLIGLDRFREVNDTLGHAMGDRLLRETARRLRENLKDVGLVARLGGDTFVVAAPHVDRPRLVDIATIVRGTFAGPFDLDGLAFRLNASVGAAVTPEHGDAAELLIQHAEVAMYVAKERHSRFEIYAPTIDQYGPRRLALLGELADAIAREQLEVHYQPIALLGSGQVVGAEALVRWRHPELGLVPPDHFIPLAEASGVITALTTFVAGRAIEDCARWRRNGHDLTVAINLSPISLHNPSLPQEIFELLDAHRLPGAALKVEITESGAMRDPELARDILGRLRAHGIQIALDDFGTGHSSLAHLRRLPVDVIKIDKSFVLDMLTSDDNKAIVVSTIDLAHSLGLTIIAEGVESDAVWQALRTHHGDAAQGYYLSRPVPVDRFVRWLQTRNELARLEPDDTSIWRDAITMVELTRTTTTS